MIEQFGILVSMNLNVINKKIANVEKDWLKS